MKIRASKTLHSCAAVRDAIGNARLLAITASSPSAMFNQIDAGKFASKHYCVITEELQRLGYKVPRSLFGMTEAPKGLKRAS